MGLTNVYVIVTIPFIVGFMVILIRKVVPAWKEMFRIATIMRSPLVNQLEEITYGSSTIKAFGRTEHF